MNILEEINKVYVIGHKNPDTDSICSAIAYSRLKNKTDHGTVYAAKRAGQINEETEFVLKYFNVEAPGYMPDAGTQVRDLEIHKLPKAGSALTIKEAWRLMNEANAVSLPITDDDGALEGIIAIGDIARFYMGNTDKSILSKARTQYRRMAETLEGRLIEGNAHGYFINGRVVIGTDSPELLSSYLEKDDLVILGNRKDTQMAAIRADASCIVISGNSPVDDEVIKLARKRSCVIIETPMDTYTIANLITQAIPVRYLMKSDGIVSFHTHDMTDEIKEVMGKYRFRDFPILDSEGRCLGTISRRNLLNARRKKLILVDHNERTQTVDNVEEADILEIIDHHRIGNLTTMSPVVFRNEPVGCTATIIYEMYNEAGVEIDKQTAGIMMAAILSDTLMFRSPTCTKYDQQAAAVLADIAGVNVEQFANDMFLAGSNLSGKAPEEIFYQDFKKFTAGEHVFGVGQINAMNQSALDDVEGRIAPFMKNEVGKNGIMMVFFMLTNIIDESTKLICVGGDSERIAEKAFGVTAHKGCCTLKGVVSRKKQLIPPLMSAMTEQ